MISLFKYIEKYGNFNFYEKEFTEVDNVILSALAYIDFNGIVSNNVKEKKTLKDVAASFFPRPGCRRHRHNPDVRPAPSDGVAQYRPVRRRPGR